MILCCYAGHCKKCISKNIFWAASTPWVLLSSIMQGERHFHRPSSARVLSNVWRPLPVVNRGRDANGLLLRPAPAGARRALVLIGGVASSSLGDRDCTGASACVAPLLCRASASWDASAGVLPLTLLGFVSVAAIDGGGSTPDPAMFAAPGESDRCPDRGAGAIDAEPGGAHSVALPYRTVPRLDRPKLYLPERLLYADRSRSASPRRPPPATAASSLRRHWCANVGFMRSVWMSTRLRFDSW